MLSLVCARNVPPERPSVDFAERRRRKASLRILRQGLPTLSPLLNYTSIA